MYFCCCCCHCRNLPHRVAEADSRQICARRVSRQQRGGHQRPSHHWWPEGQQTAVLPESVTLLVWHSAFAPPTPNPHPHHHITAALFFFHSLCSAHSQLPLASVLLLSLCLHRVFFFFKIGLWNSLVLFSFATNRKLHEAFVSGTQIFFSFLQRVNVKEAAVAVVKKPVKLKVAR